MINIYRAVKTAHLNQSFGYNLACAKLGADGKPIRPFQIITINEGQAIPEGYVRFYPVIGLLGHNGRDWAAYHSEPVYFGATDGNAGPIQATCDTEIDPDGGKGVNIVFSDPETGAWYEIKYWHLLDQLVHDGQVIKSGDLIGYADSTGASSGDHLHEGFKPLKSGNLEDKMFPDNGYTGAVDPAKYAAVHDYQSSSFILDVLNLKQQLTLMQQLYKLLLLLKGRN